MKDRIDAGPASPPCSSASASTGSLTAHAQPPTGRLLLTLSGVDVITGACRVVAALALAALGATVFLWLWRRTRDVRIRRVLVREVLARKGSGRPGDEQRARMDLSEGEAPRQLPRGSGISAASRRARALGDYARRVFSASIRPEDINGVTSLRPLAPNDRRKARRGERWLAPRRACFTSSKR
jgi:hypothetical protein